MNVFAVADTHTAVWYMFNDPRLSLMARQFIERTAEQGGQVGVSSISLVELVYLCDKDRMNRSALQDLIRALLDPDAAFHEVPVDLSIVEKMHDVPREEVPDMPDRIIAATGLRYGVPVISKDNKIRASTVQTIW